MKCNICNKQVTLSPSAKERAKKFGGSPSHYTRLFPQHAECIVRKRSEESSELLRMYATS
jgi:hypothetical protein